MTMKPEVERCTAPQDCAGCGKRIAERYLLKALELYWHEDCLKCGCCDCRLGEVGSTLFTKGNLILCKRDYLRLFGTTGYCSACSKVIPAFEMVMRARNNVYHLECFACQQCNHRFCVGDKFYLCDNKILCEYDYEERLVFASMACSPSSLAHLKRQIGGLESPILDPVPSKRMHPDPNMMAHPPSSQPPPLHPHHQHHPHNMQQQQPLHHHHPHHNQHQSPLPAVSHSSSNNNDAHNPVQSQIQVQHNNNNSSYTSHSTITQLSQSSSQMSQHPPQLSSQAGQHATMNSQSSAMNQQSTQLNQQSSPITQQSSALSQQSSTLSQQSSTLSQQSSQLSQQISQAPSGLSLGSSSMPHSITA
ncbi:Zinc finger LIM-type [Trinorchestia longiramus]|nr:Zinc finger LIM-type [Trinorchestia longiramus]